MFFIAVFIKNKNNLFTFNNLFIIRAFYEYRA